MPSTTPARRVRRRIPEDLVRTAERLFATNGIGVSLRQIAAEAGHRNPAAVQYHFGSKEGLLKAIVEYRLPSINRRRLELLDQLNQQDRNFDVRGLAEVMARPFLELDREAHYVEFLARLAAREELQHAYMSTGRDARSAELLRERLEVALGSLSPAVRENRIWMARDLMLSSIASRRARAAGGVQLALSDELFAQDLFDGMVGLLLAAHTALGASPRVDSGEPEALGILES